MSSQNSTNNMGQNCLRDLKEYWFGDLEETIEEYEARMKDEKIPQEDLK